jgi:hypothetical protein
VEGCGVTKIDANFIARTYGSDALRRTMDSGKTFQPMRDADKSVGTSSAHEFVAGLITDPEAIKTLTAAEHQERILSGNALATTGGDTDAVAPATGPDAQGVERKAHVEKTEARQEREDQQQKQQDQRQKTDDDHDDDPDHQADESQDNESNAQQVQQQPAQVTPPHKRKTKGAMAKPAIPPSVQWPDLDTHGNPKRTYRNARAAIEALRIGCTYDEFHDRMFVGGDSVGQWAGELSDAVGYLVRQTVIDVFAFDPGKDNVADAATELCLENRFDPIHDYLDGLIWDGTQRLDNWLTTYLGVEDTPLHRAIGALTLIAAVRRARKPGCKFDHILTLEGSEGTMKSTAISLLAGAENFSDQTIMTQSDKEQQELVRGVWLFEVADLAGMRRADVEKVKAFATRTHDRARPAYGRRRIDAPRRCIFIATTNEDEYLKSQTGNRRFWPVKTGTIDIDALGRDRDQLWAEAAKIEAEGAALTLPRNLLDDARAAQEDRREHDPWDDLLANACGTVYPNDDGTEEERISTDELLKTYLAIPPDRMHNTHTTRLKRTMRRLGWSGPKKKWMGGTQKRGYFREVLKTGG